MPGSNKRGNWQDDRRNAHLTNKFVIHNLFNNSVVIYKILIKRISPKKSV